MGKTMARIKNQTVINLESWNEIAEETEDLKNTGDRNVYIGDEYQDGDFYRDGEKILTKDEQIQKAISDADNTIAELIEQIYQEDLEGIFNV